MKEKNISGRPTWRRLDNSAKIFPIIATNRFSSVFRLSAVLTQDIKQEILQQAVEKTLKEYSCFRVKMKRGFFWYYLEENEKRPKVEQESRYPCKRIEKKKNHNFLFQVTYYEKKINLDVFHSLTDGNNAMEFFKRILYQYIQISQTEKFQEREENEIQIINQSIEDGYLKNYVKKKAKRERSQKAFVIPGQNLPVYAVGAIHGCLNLEEVLKVTKTKGVTITEYFTAVLIYAIYMEKYQKSRSRKPIKICIPVNLKKYFETDTILNFFSYITVEFHTKTEKFEEILTFVKQEFKTKLTKEKIVSTMSANVEIGTSMWIRMLPLFFKNILTKLAYMEIRKYTTTTLSNLGKIEVLPEYEPYIEKFFFLIAPENIEKIKCTVCSYQNKLVFSFASILADADIAKAFFRKIREDGVTIKIESNGVYND